VSESGASKLRKYYGVDNYREEK